jgi:glutamate/tyrosine decarboxylase-like PLP-dependent enzyme
LTIDATTLNRLRDELSAPLPHPTADASRLAALQAIDWLVDDFHGLADRPLGRTAPRSETEMLLGGPPPETGRPFAEVLGHFRDAIAASSVRVTHPRFLAYIPSAPTWPSVIGELLTSGTTFFGGNWQQASGPSQVELTVLRWFADWLGLPAETGGVLTSGGSEANLTALVVAREQLPEDERDRAVLYAADQCHDSIGRAALFMGLRRQQIRVLPSDGSFRPTGDAVRSGAADARRDCGRAVVANAGATRTGAIDHSGRWRHCVGVRGCGCTSMRPTAGLPRDAGGKAELDGIGEADSVTLDPHKWFGQTYESGCVLARRRAARTFTLHADHPRDVKTRATR